MNDRTLTSNGNNAEIQRLFNRAVHELGELFAGKQTIRVAGGPVTGYRFNVSEHRFAAANTALHDLGVAINRSSSETSEHRDAERYRYLRERVPFDRMIVRRTRINDHGTTVYETLQGADLDREIDECTGASEKADEERDMTKMMCRVPDCSNTCVPRSTACADHQCGTFRLAM